MDLSDISVLFFLSFVSFIIGVICFYIPFRNLKRTISQFIKTSGFFTDSSLNEAETDISTQLSDYTISIKEQIKTQSDQISFLQKKISAITSASTEAVIILNERGKLIFHNTQSKKIFHLEEQKPVHYLNEMTRSPDVMSIFKQCLEKKIVITKECVFGKKNQYIKSNFKVTAVSVSNESAKTQHIILLFYDQTNIKESQQAHIDFVSNVSHELKTPLTSIQGYVEMLTHDFKQKKFNQVENFLQTLLRNCKRMTDLINDLLNLSNLASQVDIEKKRLKTKEITSHVMEQLNPRDHQIHFFFSAPYVMANPRWVEIVLHNLVDNACRHTAKKCDVHIRWEKMRDRVVLKVIDSGKGIPAKYLHRVFERFFRVDSARSREQGGTGVGLALVKQSMEKHGGCVRAQASSLGGAEFICEFPNA